MAAAQPKNRLQLIPVGLERKGIINFTAMINGPSCTDGAVLPRCCCWGAAWGNQAAGIISPGSTPSSVGTATSPRPYLVPWLLLGSTPGIASQAPGFLF